MRLNPYYNCIYSYSKGLVDQQWCWVSCPATTGWALCVSCPATTGWALCVSCPATTGWAYVDILIILVMVCRL